MWRYLVCLISLFMLLHLQGMTQTVNSGDTIEVEGSPSVQAETTDAHDQLSVRRSIDEVTWQQTVKRPAFQYQPPSVKPPAPVHIPLFDLSKLFQGNWLRNVIWIIACLAGFFLLYQLVLRQGWKVRRKTQGHDSSTAVADVTEAETDLQADLLKALHYQDYREAVRILYLQSLQALQEKGYIRIGLNKTNTIYLQELRSTPYVQPFTLLTNYFDHTWYGHFSLQQRDFEFIQQRFRQFTDTLV